MTALQTIPDVGFIGELLSRVGVPPSIADPIGDAIAFVLVFVAIYIIGKIAVLRVLDRLMTARDLDRHAKAPLRKLAWFTIIFAGIAIAFGSAGYGSFLQSLATIAAAATLAIGFAMQDVLKNLVAGIFIFTDRPFRIGDWIEWDGNVGIVEDISLRVTRVRTFDNELLTVPNSHLTDSVIKNPVAKDTLRLKFVFGIGYDDDIEEASRIIIDEAEAHESILEDPAPSVRLVELGDSSIGLQSRFWIANPSRSDFSRIRGDYVKSVKERFDETGIDIPYPQRELSGGVEIDGELVQP